MTITNIGLQTAEQFALDYFDAFDQVGIGTGTNPALQSDTGLSNEVLRDIADLIVKNVTDGEYDVEIKFGLSDAAGETIAEVGLFNQASGGTMAMKLLLPVVVPKTANQELTIKFRITVEAVNN